MNQPLAVNEDTPAISQCPECGANVYQAKINRDSVWEYILVEVTPVPPGQGSLALDFGDFEDTYDYPVAVEDADTGTIVEHPHQ